MNTTAADSGDKGAIMSKGIECPHCGEEMSKAFAVKSLAMLAKSEGHDLDAELSSLADEESTDETDPDIEKGHGPKSGKKAGRKGMDVGNKTASHRGKAPGAMHSSSRGKGTGEAVQRTAKPGNPITKSMRLPIFVGQARLVEYVYGADDHIAKGIQDGTHHVPPARNARAQRELATGEATPE